MTTTVSSTIPSLIPPLDTAAGQTARAHLDTLTKPLGALGELENLAARLAAIRGAAPSVGKKSLFIFAADHGVTCRGISAYPSAVTPQMVLNFVRGGAAANVLARQLGASVTVVDMGVNFEFDSEPPLMRKVRRGTRDFCVEDAMTAAECEQAIAAGRDLALGSDADLLLAGEMGIGNTTAAAALFCALFDLQPADIAGRGTGIDDAALHRKVEAIELGLARHGTRRDPLEILASLGGYEIAAIAGFALGAASRRIPMVVDGFIATAGVAIAMALHPDARPFFFFGHRSNERAHAVVLQRLGVSPLLDLGLRLGEGTGALLASHILEAACRIYHEMATFGSAGVSGPS